MQAAQSVSPSQQDGLSARAEAVQLAYAADLIRESSTALRLTHSVCVFAQHLLHRFYTCVSLTAHSTIWTAGACLLLSSKLADQPRSVRHVSNVLFDRLHAREKVTETVLWDGKSRRRPLDFYGAAGYDWKREVVETERHVLKELGFRVVGEVPHKLVLIFVNTLRDKAGAPGWTDGAVGGFKGLVQGAWNFANDAMRVRICVSEDSAAVACGCISLAAERCSGKLPDGWMGIFGCSLGACERVMEGIRAGYLLGFTDGMFVDYSLSRTFRKFHPAELKDDDRKYSAGKRKVEESVIHVVEVRERRKRSRFEDKQSVDE